MVDSITLTAGLQNALQIQQRVSLDIDRTTENIATGRNVNRAVDDPIAYFKARDLSNRAGDLLQVKDSIGQSLSTIESASIGLEALGRTVDQLRSIVSGARGGTSEEREAAAELYDQVLQQLDQLAGDTGYAGVSLTSGSPDSLDVTINDQGDTLSVSGAAADSTGLGVSSAVSVHNGFATDADIDAALNELGDARSAIRSRESAYLTDVSVLSVREQFSEDLSSTLQVGADSLVNADIEEEAANLLALQVRQKLGVVSLNLIAEKGNAIAGLF